MDSKTIRKHRNDVFRLFQIIGTNAQTYSPAAIVQDMLVFHKQMAAESIDLQSLGLGTRNLPDVLEQRHRAYPV